jgi:hypothetical protein
MALSSSCTSASFRPTPKSTRDVSRNTAATAVYCPRPALSARLCISSTQLLTQQCRGEVGYAPILPTAGGKFAGQR